jgi:hypothetical protein
MALAPNFDKHLKRFLDKKAPKYEWITGWSAERQRWKADVAGIPRRPGRIILVEVELKKDNPVENVVKIWRWLRENRDQPVLFVQAFSGWYKSTKKKQLKQKQYDRSTFIGEWMKEDQGIKAKYRVIPMIFKPSKGHTKKGDRRMIIAARLLGAKIVKLARSG